MAKFNMTAGATVTRTGRVYSVLVTVNTGFTGTITITDTDGTTSLPVAVITNPATGGAYRYWDFQLGLSVVTSATGDITVSYQSRNRATE